MRQLILTGILCGMALAASCFWGAYTLEGTRPAVYPVKVVKIMQKPTFPRPPAQIIDSTVGIEQDGQLIGAGVILQDGLVLTAAHVLRGPGRYTVRLGRKDGHVLASELRVLKVDEKLDLALVSCFTVDPVKPVKFAGKDITLLTPVVTVGSPAGVAAKLISPLGFLSKKSHDLPIWDGNWIISASSFFGNSGGPVFDANTGCLVGIVVGGAGGMSGMAPNVIFIVPAPTIQEFLNGQI